MADSVGSAVLVSSENTPIASESGLRGTCALDGMITSPPMINSFPCFSREIAAFLTALLARHFIARLLWDNSPFASLPTVSTLYHFM